MINNPQYATNFLDETMNSKPEFMQSRNNRMNVFSANTTRKPNTSEGRARLKTPFSPGGKIINDADVLQMQSRAQSGRASSSVNRTI